MATIAGKTYSTKDIIKIVINLGLPLSLFLIPTNDVFTAQLRMFCVISLLAILCFAFESANQTTVAILLPVAYVFIAGIDASVVFSPWMQYIPWATLSGLVMATALQSSGLLARISYFCILRTGSSYKGIVWGVGLTAFFMTLCIGDMTIPMAALTYGICIAMETGKSRASAGIMLAAAMGCLSTAYIGFLGPIFMIGVGSSVTGDVGLLGYFEAWFVNAPSIILFFVMLFIITKVLKPEKEIQGREYFEKKYVECGKIKKNEIKAGIVLIIYLVFIIFHDKLFANISLEWGLAFIPMLMAVPGIGCATEKDMRSIPFGLILFVTACMGIGTSATSLGVGDIVSNVMGPMLEGKSIVVFLLIVWAILVLMNFAMTPLAMEATFTVPFATLAVGIGLNPLALYYLMANACDQIIFPYEYALYMIYFAFGLIRMKDFMKIMGIKMVLDFIMVFAILIPWWKLIGFV